MTVEATTRGSTVSAAARNSPLQQLAGQLAAVSGGVRIRELPFLTQLNLRVDARGPAAGSLRAVLGTALPVRPNTSAQAGDLSVLWLGPDEWLVLGPDGAAQDLSRTLRQAVGSEPGAVVDLSAHRTTIELSGSRSADVLGKGCSIDLHPSVFPPGACAQTLLARSGLILQARAGDEPAYWLLVRSSFAAYVARWLIDAGLEYAVGADSLPTSL